MQYTCIRLYVAWRETVISAARLSFIMLMLFIGIYIRMDDVFFFSADVHLNDTSSVSCHTPLYAIPKDKNGRICRRCINCSPIQQLTLLNSEQILICQPPPSRLLL